MSWLTPYERAGISATTGEKIAALICDQSDTIAHFYAVAKIRRALFWRPLRAAPATTWFGLVRVIRSTRERQRVLMLLREVPKGWKARRFPGEGRPIVYLAPWWVMWALVVVRECRHWGWRLLVASGLWVDVPECGYYHEGRWRWKRKRSCWIRHEYYDRRTIGRPSSPRFRACIKCGELPR